MNLYLQLFSQQQMFKFDNPILFNNAENNA